RTASRTSWSAAVSGCVTGAETSMTASMHTRNPNMTTDIKPVAWWNEYTEETTTDDGYAKSFEPTLSPLYSQKAIDSLRAEVGKRNGIDPWAVLIRAQEAEARADRLAEALLEAYGQVRELCDCYGH